MVRRVAVVLVLMLAVAGGRRRPRSGRPPATRDRRDRAEPAGAKPKPPAAARRLRPPARRPRRRRPPAPGAALRRRDGRRCRRSTSGCRGPTRSSAIRWARASPTGTQIARLPRRRSPPPRRGSRSVEYGRTYEGRPLKLVAISSAGEPGAAGRAPRAAAAPRRSRSALGDDERERARQEPAGGGLARLRRARRRGLLRPRRRWWSPTCSPPARATSPELLDNIVVLIDPLCNPDGRERYVHGYEQRQGAERRTRTAAAAEHFQPWPGGRQNHYLIDLNRDWAWATPAGEPRPHRRLPRLGAAGLRRLPRDGHRLELLLPARRRAGAPAHRPPRRCPGSTPSAAPTPRPSTARAGSTTRTRTTTSSTPATATPIPACTAPSA